VNKRPPPSNRRDDQRPIPPGRAPARPSRRDEPINPTPTDWSDVAQWYDDLIGKDGSEYQRHVVHPKTMKLLGDVAEKRVLDVACGQGVFCRMLHSAGAIAIGTDSAGPLIERARQHNASLAERSTSLSDSNAGPSKARRSGQDLPEGDETQTPSVVKRSPKVAGKPTSPLPIYQRIDARELDQYDSLKRGSFDLAVCLLAVQNINPIGPLFTGTVKLLKPGGRLVVVLMHPCFRSPKATSWGWEASQVQYRRVDRYLLPRKEPITMNPGKKDGKYTWTFHRPIQEYVHAAFRAGATVDALEEWPSHKISDSGPRAHAENVARAEIPMFLAMRVVKALTV